MQRNEKAAVFCGNGEGKALAVRWKVIDEVSEVMR